MTPTNFGIITFFLCPETPVVRPRSCRRHPQGRPSRGSPLGFRPDSARISLGFRPDFARISLGFRLDSAPQFPPRSFRPAVFARGFGLLFPPLGIAPRFPVRACAAEACAAIPPAGSRRAGHTTGTLRCGRIPFRRAGGSSRGSAAGVPPRAFRTCSPPRRRGLRRP